jgi:eukaryotic-like serine/threonine-protein kinase
MPGSRDRDAARASTVAGDLDLDTDAPTVAPGVATADDGAILPEVMPGTYERRGVLGSGGLGRVYEARDARLRRIVAIKELRQSSASAADRFVREALITARLQHPGIIPVYEAGRWPGGEPFYAMKKVAGTSLAQAIEARPTMAARLALLPSLIAAADAIAYAHAQRVIHRDIKPHNIMLGAFGETVVIDWGLAKDLASGLAEASSDAGVTAPEASAPSSPHTVAGTVLGTYAYMSPEQARGDPVDERTDVYALGAVLYQLLAGAAPHAGVDRREVAPVASRAPIAPRDLVAIVDRAMAPDPAARYPSAQAFVEDLRRFQTGQLVSVRDYHAGERLVRWLARHRAVTGVALAAVVAVAVTGTISVWRVLDERDRASRARAVAEAQRDEVVRIQATSQLDQDPTATLAWLAQLPDRALDVDAAGIAADALGRGVARHVLRVGEAPVVAVALGDDAGFALTSDGALLRFAPDRGDAALWVSAGAPAMAIARLGAEVAIGRIDRVVIASATGVRELVATTSPVRAIAGSPDGAMVAVGTVEGAASLTAVRDGATTEFARFGAEVRDLAFSPDGAHVAVATYDRAVAVFRTADGAAVLRGAHDGPVAAIAWAPDGRALASAGDTTARIWNLDGGAPTILRGHGGDLLAVAFHPDGRRLATSARDRTVRTWTRDGAPLGVLARDLDVLRVVPTPDGQRWVCAGTDKQVWLWEADGSAVHGLRGHGGYVSVAAVSPGGRTIVSGGQDGTIRVWANHRSGEVLVHGGGLVTASRDGRALLQLHGGRMVRHDVATGARADLGVADGLRWLGSDGDGGLGVADAGRVAVVPAAGELSWRAAAAAELGAASRFGGDVVAAGYDGNLYWWRGDGGPDAVPAHRRYVLATHVLPGGDRLATAGDEGKILIWDRQRRVVQVLDAGQTPVHAIAIDERGAHLAAGNVTGDVTIWRLRDGARLGGYRHAGPVRALAFAAGGDTLATAGDDRRLRIWRGGDAPAVELAGSPQTLSAVAFSPDGALVATGSTDGSVRVWALANHVHRPLRGHDGAVSQLRFLDDGGLLSVGADGRAIRWRPAAFAPLPHDGPRLRAVLRTTTATIDDRAGTVLTR